MRFFEGDDNSGRGGNIIESVVRMTKWLGMSVIAEGVEDKDQADFLKSIGCYYIQGYLYSKPIPEANYRLLSSRTNKEEKLLSLETVDNLDNNSFWDPKSMDTLIFNSYVGAACIFEYCDGKIELLRVSPKYIRLISKVDMNSENALKLDWNAHLGQKDRELLRDSLEKSVSSRSDVQVELTMLDIPKCPSNLYLRFNLRVIAKIGDRCLVYCFYENMTEQREAERHDRETTGQLKAVLDNVACGITAVSINDGTLSFIMSNDRYYELIGYTREQYESEVGDDPYIIIYPDDRTMLTSVIQEVLKTEELHTVEYRVKRRDGNIVWIRSNISMAVVAGIDGKTQLSTYTDITEQKEAELELQDTSMQLKKMMDDIPGGFAQICVYSDGSMKLAYVNEGLCRLTGMNYNEFVSQYKNDVFMGVHPGDVSVFRSAVYDMIENGEAQSGEYRIRHKNGDYVWVSVFGRSSVDSSDNRLLNIYFMDSTEKVKEEERQKELLDNLPYGVALYEYDGNTLSVIHINQRYWKLFGREKTVYSDDAFFSALYPDDREQVIEELNRAIKEKRDVSCDIRILYGKNEYRRFHVTGRILRKSDGRYAIYSTYTPVSSDGELV